MPGMTSTTLLASARRRASIPTTSATGAADADLLAYANEEMQRHLVAAVMSAREEFFVRNQDTTISGVNYRIPHRAIGGKLRGVFLLDSSSNVMGRLSRVEPEQLEDYTSTTSLQGFLLESNTVRLIPGTSTTATKVRLSYFARPNDLTVTTSDWATVSSVSGNVITTTAAHGFTTSSVLDIVKGTPGYEHVVVSVSPSATTSDTLTIDLSAVTVSVEAGDYVTVQKVAPVPQLPMELHDVLAQRVACRYLEAVGDKQGLSAALTTLEAMEADAGFLLTPRVDASPQKIINRYGALGGVRWRNRSTGD